MGYMKKMISMISCLILMLSLAGCGSMHNLGLQSGVILDKPKSYMFAVDYSYYGYDNWQTGVYDLHNIDIDTSNGQTMNDWYIYMSDTYYQKPSDIPKEALAGHVGGEENETLTLEFKKETYVYVIYDKKDTTNLTGSLQIIKVGELK